MIFVDANIPMYLVGEDHPNKARAQMLVERAALSGDALVTDAEVFQEVLHRFAAIRRLEAIDPTFTVLLAVVDQVISIAIEDVLHARKLMTTVAHLGARDAIHAAVMANHDIDRILSFDADFDLVPGVTRLS